jgi:hypothetical protein
MTDVAVLAILAIVVAVLLGYLELCDRVRG